MRKILVTAALLPFVALGARALAADMPTPPPGPGLDLINERCVFCHNSAQIFTQRKTAPAWSATVEQMAARGAEVSPEEMKVITDYLAKNYAGPDPTTAPATPAAPHS